ncbi:MAG: GNAT family N-acetyltransferase [Acetobacteraceae bacterium]
MSEATQVRLLPLPAHDVTVDEISAPDRLALARLLQLYLHDFSEFAPLESPLGEVGGDGLFSLGLLEENWQGNGRAAFFIRARGRIAGFVLLHRWSALDRPLDRAIAEFFVLRKYRRKAVGTGAAHRAFRRFPGRWEVPVAEYNHPALRFWRSALSAPNFSPVTEQPGDGRRWSGPVFCFDNRAQPGG